MGSLLYIFDYRVETFPFVFRLSEKRDPILWELSVGGTI